MTIILDYNNLMAKKKKKKFQWRWILVIFVGIVLLAAYGSSKNDLAKTQQALSGYALYKDSTYGFSINYPKAWEIRKDTQVFENGDTVAFQIKGPTQKRYTEFIDGARFIISKPFDINTNLAIWMKSYFDPQAKFSKLPLNNYTFEAVENCEYSGCMRYYFTKINNQIYGIALFAEGASAEKASYENALIHMLKSLQFTNATNNVISEDEAISKIKALPEVIDYLKRVPNGLVLVNGEEDSVYMVQVYEFKNNQTATFNWYKVNKSTGTIEKQF